MAVSPRSWLDNRRLWFAIIALALAVAVAQGLLWWLGPGPKASDFIGPPRSGYTLHNARVTEYNTAGQPDLHVQTPQL